MSLASLLPSWAARAGRPTRRRRHEPVGARFQLESLEGRLVLSHMMAPPAAGHAAAEVHTLARANAQQVTLPINLTGISLTNLTRDASGVVSFAGTATGTILGKDFTTPLTGTITPAKNARSTPILNLHLEPIHLSLLGLNVNTSPICLNISAQKGGGLLGNLLGNGLSGVLGTAGGTTTGGTTTGGTATGATSAAQTQLQTLLNNGQFLNGLNRILAQPARLAPVAATQGTSCPVLNLSVGPVRLNLLGLKVRLDNCSNGPVTVNVSATQGGGLLGDLLCNLSGTGAGRPVLRQVNALLQQITNTAAPVTTPVTSTV